MRRPHRSPRRRTRPSRRRPTTTPADDPSWLLVSVLSAEVSVEEAEASGVLPLPGSADRALMQLDGAERMELAKILREELAAKTPAAPQGPGA